MAKAADFDGKANETEVVTSESVKGKRKTSILGTKARLWLITINNPQNHGISLEQSGILERFKEDIKTGRVTYVASVMEQSLTVDENDKHTPHGHIAAYFPSQELGGHLHKLFPMAALQDCKANILSVRQYLIKDPTGAWYKKYPEKFGEKLPDQTFRWDSEASAKAHVHCVIVGFSVAVNTNSKKLFIGDKLHLSNNINAYLMDAPNVFIESRNTPLNGVLSMSSGGKPVEGGYYIFTDDEKNAFLKKEPSAQTYFRKFVGSDDFINGYTRWCLWLHDVSPSDIRKLPECMKRVNSVHDYRLESKKAATRAAAATPMSFMEIKRPVGKFLIVPEVSSQRRKYVPLGFSDKEMICSNKVRFVSNATMYHFGILTSNVHMAWMRAVCGRLKSDYSYSINVVYNNFPWPTPTEQQKAKIEQTAKAILDARALYPDSSLADLYDDLTMPPELRKAHQANDRAVMDAYGFIKGTAARTSESACVAELMKLYQQKVSAAQSK